MAPLPRSIALTGIKHVGKSTIGESLARELSVSFFDIDDLIVRRARHDGVIGLDGSGEPPIRTVFRLLGPDGFARWELDAILEVPALSHGEPVVIATGGGIADHRPAMEHLHENYTVLYLADDPLVLFERATRHGLPAFLDRNRPREHFLEIAARRDAVYRRFAHVTVEAGGRPAASVLQGILNQVR